MIPLFSNNNKSQCCGCELCAAVCPISIISMRADEEGFVYPEVTDETACIDCHLCEKKCPTLNRIVRDRQVLRFFSAISKEESNIKTSSSGGIATLISRSFIRNGGVVYGVRYSSNYEVIEYDRAVNEEELFAFKTSKYCQSLKGPLWKNIKEDVSRGKRVLLIGLPCEIAALNNWFPHSGNIYTIELVCHGVTSPLIHNAFIKEIKNNPNYSKAIMNYFSVRYKLTGWKPYYIYAHFVDGRHYLKQFRSSSYDIAFRYLKRPSCNWCHFKYGDKEYGLQADVTIGDNHGVKKDAVTYNQWGSSIVLVHTRKGQELFNSISSDIIYQEENDTIVYQNLALYKPFPRKNNRKNFAKLLVRKGLQAACKLPSVIYTEKKIEFKRRLQKIIRKII